jgi:hypothetical protein
MDEKKKAIPGIEDLEHLLAPEKSQPWAITEAVCERYGESESLPAEWAEPLLKACLDDSRSRQQRSEIMCLLNRLPSEKLAKIVEDLVYLDSGIVHDAAQEGNMRELVYHVDAMLPGYREVPAVEEAIKQILVSAMDAERRADANFLGVDEDAMDWLDDPDNVPDQYNIPNTCATCDSFYPRDISDEGVLGECAVHSTELGLFAHTSTCKRWAERS